MRFHVLVFALSLFVVACSDTGGEKASTDLSQLSPEQVCKLWQKSVDSNDFETAKQLSTPKTREFVASIEKLIGGDESGMALDTTVFLSMNCTENGEDANCAYTFQLEGEVVADSFFLKRIDGKWLVDIKEEPFIEEEDTEEILKQLNEGTEMLFE
ncbi:MAG: hypothetical protein R2769_01175 [Saprospiraceae bacterium]|nr:hypothetical protein [Saprospiraceae bacterium]